MGSPASTPVIDPFQVYAEGLGLHPLPMQLLGLFYWELNMSQIELLCKRCGLGCRDAIADSSGKQQHREH